MTKDKLLSALSEFYTLDKQLELGVLGIRIGIL